MCLYNEEWVSHSQKSETFRFDKSANIVKKNKKKKRIIGLIIGLPQKCGKMLDCITTYSLFFKIRNSENSIMHVTVTFVAFHF